MVRSALRSVCYYILPPKSEHVIIYDQMRVGHNERQTFDIKIEMSQVLLCKTDCINHITVANEYP